MNLTTFRTVARLISQKDTSQTIDHRGISVHDAVIRFFIGIESDVADTVSAQCKHLSFMQAIRQRETFRVGRVNDILERILVAHELGHAVLHAQIAMMKGFQEMEVLDGSSLEEDEANFFAAELLLEDSEVLELLSEYSFFETAKQLYVPAALLDYKFSLLHEKGELLNPMYIRKSDFLKDDLGDYDDTNHFDYE